MLIFDPCKDLFACTVLVYKK